MKSKLTLAAVILGLVGSVQAASDGKQSDIMFMPKAGGFQYYGKLDYAFGDYENNYSRLGSANVTQTTSKFDTERWVLKNSLDYGLMERLSLGLDINYQMTSTVENKSGTTNGVADTGNQLEAKTDDKGLQNIGLNGRYRVMEEEPVNLDFQLGFDFRLGDDEKSYSYAPQTGGNNKADEGNAYSAHAMKLGSEVGTNVGKFQWKGLLGLNYMFEHDVYLLKADTNAAGQNVNLKEKLKAHNDIALGLAGNYFFMPAFSMGFGADFLLVGKREYTYASVIAPTTTNTLTEKSHTDIALGIDGKYEFTKNVMGSLGLGYTFGGEYDVTNVTAGTTTSQYKKKDVNETKVTFGVGVLF
ncbi:MAG: hypothetical protein HQK52_14230 [Oligoflexia bacterium]|nr:hypothetical protein [Oligoflexia bacterium]